MLALILVLSSVNCEEIVTTLREYQEYSDISEQDIKKLAGRCAEYLERTEDS